MRIFRCACCIARATRCAAAATVARPSCADADFLRRLSVPSSSSTTSQRRAGVRGGQGQSRRGARVGARVAHRTVSFSASVASPQAHRCQPRAARRPPPRASLPAFRSRADGAARGRRTARCLSVRASRRLEGQSRQPRAARRPPPRARFLLVSGWRFARAARRCTAMRARGCRPRHRLIAPPARAPPLLGGRPMHAARPC